MVNNHFTSHLCNEQDIRGYGRYRVTFAIESLLPLWTAQMQRPTPSSPQLDPARLFPRGVGWLGHGAPNSRATCGFCGGVGLFGASLWKDTGRCWAVTGTPSALRVCLDVAGNAAEVPNAHVCLGSSAWCRWCLLGGGICLFLRPYPKARRCPNFCRVGQRPRPAE